MSRLTAEDRAGLAEIDRIIGQIAATLGEEPEIEVKRPGKGWIRIQYKRSSPRYRRSEHRDYLGVPAALEGARTALGRAENLAARRKAGAA